MDDHARRDEPHAARAGQSQAVLDIVVADEHLPHRETGRARRVGADQRPDERAEVDLALGPLVFLLAERHQRCHPPSRADAAAVQRQHAALA